MRPELVDRWSTPDGLRRRQRLVALGLRGPWRDVLAGFPGTAELGDNLGDLRGIDLTQEELPGADLVRARLDGARLDDCGLIDARLDLATLSGASLTWARLDRASLTACVALGTRWDDACLEGAVLTAANLAGGSFRRARLQGARLTTASLMKADLRCADLRGTELSLCDLEGAWVSCVRSDRPRTYAREKSDPRALHYYRKEAAFPSFLDAILLEPGLGSLRGLSRGDTLLHVEAAVESSLNLEAEVRAPFDEQHWAFHMLGATALLLGGTRPGTLDALWERIDRGSPAHPQLAVAAMLTDPSLDVNARARLADPSTHRPEVRAALAWALRQRTGREVKVDLTRVPLEYQHPERDCERWLERLRRHVGPGLQAAWLHPAPA